MWVWLTHIIFILSTCTFIFVKLCHMLWEVTRGHANQLSWLYICKEGCGPEGGVVWEVTRGHTGNPCAGRTLGSLLPLSLKGQQQVLCLQDKNSHTEN